MVDNYKHNYDNVSLIVLKGAANSGKTTTLKKLIQFLENDSNLEKNISLSKKFSDKEELAVFKSTNITIIVLTRGDKKNFFDDLFKLLDDLNKKLNSNHIIIVCPCKKTNRKDSIIKFLNDNFNDIEPVIKEKSISNEKIQQELDNEKEAMALKELLYKKIEQFKGEN